MLILKLEPDEWIVLRDRKTKKEYGRLRRADNKTRILFDASWAVEIERIPINEKDLDLTGRLVT